MSSARRYTIAAVCAMTGINANTLRAWERRHGLLAPERTEKGYRLYRDEDVRRLRLIVRALDQGVPVRLVLRHLDDPRASAGLARGPWAGALPPAPAAARSAPPDPALASLVDLVADAAVRFDRAVLDRAFARAAGLHSLRLVFAGVLAPALARVGSRFMDEPTGVAEEHFLTAYVRERLAVALAGLRPAAGSPRVLGACVPGDAHDLGLLLLALELGLVGADVLLLGPSVPFPALIGAARATAPQAIVLSATLAVPEEPLEAACRALVAEGVRAPVLLGGPAALRQRAALEARGLDVLSLDPAEAAADVLELIAAG